MILDTLLVAGGGSRCCGAAGELGRVLCEEEEDEGLLAKGLGFTF